MQTFFTRRKNELIVGIIGVLCIAFAYSRLLLLQQDLLSIVTFFLFTLLCIWFCYQSIQDLKFLKVSTTTTVTGFFIILFLVVLSLLFIGFNSEILINSNTSFSPLNSLITGLSLSFFTALLVMVTKGKALGDADIYFFGIQGFICGFPDVFNALYITFGTALVYGLFTALKKRTVRSIRIPFIPFISLGTLVAFLLGQYVLIGFFW